MLGRDFRHVTLAEAKLRKKKKIRKNFSSRKMCLQLIPAACWCAQSGYSTSTGILLLYVGLCHQMTLVRSIPALKTPEKQTLGLCLGTLAKLSQGHTRDPACGLTHICMFQSSNIVGPIPTHQRDVAQALQSSDHKLLQKETRSENWQPACSDTLQPGLGYMSWSSASVLRSSPASHPDSTVFTFRLCFRNAELERAQESLGEQHGTS